MLGFMYEYEKKREQAFKLADMGEFELTSAMYYNDQPPEIMYYEAMAIKELGNAAEA
ncbi:MAG: hypothetical protein ACI38A_03075 [Candidatus Ornithomonoglobus sp.]